LLPGGGLGKGKGAGPYTGLARSPRFPERSPRSPGGDGKAPIVPPYPGVVRLATGGRTG
jgi:hypothetical protein